MPNYSVDGQGTNTLNTTVLYVVAGATLPRRMKIFEIIIGSAVSADASAETVIQRITNEDGTPGGTAVTPTSNDPADQAAVSNAVQDPANEPTFAANLILVNLPGHQRATLLWAPAEGREIITPATEDNGIGARSIVAASPWTMVVTMRYSE